MKLSHLLILPHETACAATQHGRRRFTARPASSLGLWHGLIFPVAWLVSLFASNIAVYAVPNNGGWYDFGYFLGIVVFGVGARRGHRAVGGAMNRAPALPIFSSKGE